MAKLGDVYNKLDVIQDEAKSLFASWENDADLADIALAAMHLRVKIANVEGVLDQLSAATSDLEVQAS